VVIVAALVWFGVQALTGDSDGASGNLRFSEALALVRESPSRIEHVTFHPSTQKVDFRLSTGRTRTTVYPVDESAYELQKLLEEKKVAFEAKNSGSSPAWSILTSLLPFVLLFAFWIFLMGRIRQKPTTEQASPETSSRY
jgi:ATP-dependent Zn protease